MLFVSGQLQPVCHGPVRSEVSWGMRQQARNKAVAKESILDGSLSKPPRNQQNKQKTETRMYRRRRLISGTPATTASATPVIAGPVLTGARFVDGQFAAVPLGAVQGFNGGIGAFLGFHGHKSETAWPLADFVGDEMNLGNRPVLGESVLKIVFADIEREVTDV